MLLTRRGWSLAGAAIGMYVGGRLLGLVELSVLAVSTVFLLVAAYAWVRIHPPALTARRDLKERLQVGVDGRVDLTLHATTRRTATLAVADFFDHGRRAARFLLPPLVSGEEARAAYRFPTERRGRFEVGPLRATLSDPFGLVSDTRRILGSEEVVVYPRVHEVPAPPEVGGLDLDRDHPHVRSRVEPTGEFMTLRDYAPGDDLRHVHWRSTARRGHLVVRQNETRRRAPVLLLLDVRPRAYDRNAFERAVEACASLAAALDRAGRPFEVVLSTGTVLGIQGRRHLTNVMDELAVVEPHGPDRFVIAATRRRTGELVAVTGRLARDDATALGVLVRDGGTLIGVTTDASAEWLGARSRRFRTFALAYEAGERFDHAWNQAVMRWQHRALLPSSTSRAPA